MLELKAAAAERRLQENRPLPLVEPLYWHVLNLFPPANLNADNTVKVSPEPQRLLSVSVVSRGGGREEEQEEKEAAAGASIRQY